jgi:hypothetical protein
VSDPGPAGLLAIEFVPEWDIALRPGGLSIVSAYRQSEDGRHRWFVVAYDAVQLLAALRAIRACEQAIDQTI